MTSISDASTLRDDRSTYSSSDTITNNGSLHNFPTYADKTGLAEKKAETILEESPASVPAEKPVNVCHFMNTLASKAMCIMDKRLDDPVMLYHFIMASNTALNPEMTIRILGSHTYEVKNGDNTTTVTEQDFRIHAPLKLIDPISRVRTAAPGKSVHRRNRRRDPDTTIANADDAVLSLEQWCERFCKSKWPLRVLRVETQCNVPNQKYLRNEICEQIRKTGYRGDIHVSFQVIGGAKNGIDFYAASWIHRLRQTKLWMWFIVLTCLTPIWWAIVYPIIIYTTYYWDICTLEWQAEMYIGDEVCDAHTWLTQYSELIKDLAKSRFSGSAAHLWKYGVNKTPGIPRPAQARIVDKTKGSKYDIRNVGPGEWGHHGTQWHHRYT